MSTIRITVLLLLASAFVPPGPSWGQAGGLEFLTVVADEEVPEDDLAEYKIGPHVARYQVVKIDTQMLREFILRDSERSDREDALPMRFTLFDEEPIDFFGEISQIFSEGEAAGFAGWVGLSKGDVPFTCTVKTGLDNRVTIDIDSEAGHFKISATDFPPYHVLWQWNPEFQERPVTHWEGEF